MLTLNIIVQNSVTWSQLEVKWSHTPNVLGDVYGVNWNVFVKCDREFLKARSELHITTSKWRIWQDKIAKLQIEVKWLRYALMGVVSQKMMWCLSTEEKSKVGIKCTFRRVNKFDIKNLLNPVEYISWKLPIPTLLLPRIIKFHLPFIRKVPSF